MEDSNFRPSPLALAVLSLLHTAPLHPYGMQRLIKLWGKDQVVNVGQRTALYRTIERLEEGGLVAVRGTGRDQQYPERTVYELTDKGRAVLARAKKLVAAKHEARLNELLGPANRAALLKMLATIASEF